MAYDRYQIQIFHLGQLKTGDYVSIEYEYSNINKSEVAPSYVATFQRAAFENVYQELVKNRLDVDTWKDAMEAIRTGKADYAVLPIENSSAGIVSENYDLLVEYDNYIVGEQIIRINHALLGLADAQESDITKIYSHKQSLMQCSDFLEAHKEWEKFSLSNNAVAAKKVKEDGRVDQAAFASA